ncbi:hypothetical protein IWX65_001392 [Arthrobacter sp. CAN_A214]|uniref:hypothetical protein n=1 Tax=Arthrobacter sp. CAN_A214 TaxID=2787720 RepID=UPI0018CB8E90
MVLTRARWSGKRQAIRALRCVIVEKWFDLTSIQAKPAGPASGDRAGTLVPGRDRYLDLLRAIALVRIVALHTFFNAVWLTVVFPSLGVMFALAGALMARSLERPALGDTVLPARPHGPSRDRYGGPS